MVRSCRWQGSKADSWDVDLLEPNTDLPEDLKRAVLDLEGESSSWKVTVQAAWICHFTVLCILASRYCQGKLRRSVEGSERA